MKKSHILAILVIGFAIFVIISTMGDASQYVGFNDAYAMSQEGDDSKVHVIGMLKRNEAKEVIGLEYNPSLDPNYLSFILIDEKNQEQKVVCYNPPASMKDLEKSEKIVVIGRVKDGQFIASEILMKCPSKYEEKELKA
jgi:cytochrome c-type biogenesis protein CcmE